MSSLHYQALSGRRKRRTRSSPFVSAVVLVAVAALLALLQSMGADDGIALARAAKPAVAGIVLGS